MRLETPRDLKSRHSDLNRDLVVGQNLIQRVVYHTSCPIGAVDDGPSWTSPGAATAAVHKMTVMTVSSAEIHRASADRASDPLRM